MSDLSSGQNRAMSEESPHSTLELASSDSERSFTGSPEQALTRDLESFILPVEQVEPDPSQPRDDFGSLELHAHIQELARDIAENGQLDPIVVVPIGNSRYRILAGECRWRAIRDVNKGTTIRATIRYLDGDQARQDVIQLTSNEKRRDFSKLQLARAYERLQQCYGWSEAELARRLNRSRQYISAVKKVLRAPPVVQEALQEGRLSWRSWVRDTNEVLRNYGVEPKNTSPGDPIATESKANILDVSVTGESKVTLPQSVIHDIAWMLQYITRKENLNIDIPRNPTRRQISELITELVRKLR